ncbi:hypothetical protein SNOG_04342 [Parastagonospora nodorum SN15]|uniref:Uncharacterized protein n=1 Tax=Phaeosphaeria nodorum (strain SN15 / ATCC MYA-4574 / FGSC 10173) TaxID=321614 RepID=Q0UV72_PHANO|nr:hypothetical protein SNOG_04342 [Parastagonospora nodorum SN15]EAT88102.1 hypothetical protein SNOG_04342 [Parastagonospora nodorum SN15]
MYASAGDAGCTARFRKETKELAQPFTNDRNIVQAEEFSLAMGYGTHDTLL